MAEQHLEVERKLDVDGSFALPDLGGLPGVASIDPPVEHDLEATYFDTPDLRLARGRVTLRRRTGGTDAGWHQKLPVEGARRELHRPLGRAVKNPPRGFTVPVTGLLRGGTLGPVATLRTHRLATVLRDAEGRALAEIADDSVTGTALAGADRSATVLHWREVEAELVEGDESLLAAIERALVAAGARPATSPSKLSRVLADRLGAVDGTRPRRKATAAEVVLAAVRVQVDALQQADVMVRTDQPDAVHRLRVAARRLRSILAAYRPVLDRARTDRLRAELRWLGGELSAARDGEVVLAALRDLLATQPPELVLGPVAARLEQAAIRQAEEGTARALATLDDPRYLRLLEGLHGLLADPPLAAHARDRARPVARAAVRRAGRQLRGRLGTARTATGAERARAVHEVRKAVKRLRYTAEVAEPVLGRPAAVLIDRAVHAQELLGAGQDAVAAGDACRRLGLAAHAAGENGWTWGRLHALAEARAESTWAEFDALARSLRRAVKAAANPG